MVTHQQRLTFSNQSGQILTGILHLPLGQPRAFAVFAHCFTCSTHLDSTSCIAASCIAEALTLAGLGVLSFDFKGLQQPKESTDEWLSASIDDLLAAADTLRARHAAPVLLVGHGLGGTAVLAVAKQLPEVTAVVTIGAPGKPEALRELQEQALLVLHAPDDSVVARDDAYRIFQAAKGHKSFMALPHADHLLTRKEDALYAGQVISTWVDRYLPGRAVNAPDASNDTRVRLGAQGLTSTVLSEGHSLLADEPLELGGNDRGPTPYGFLLSALGACTAMTLRMYAQHKRWPLTGVDVALTHQRVHARDCADCEVSDRKVTLIECSITLWGPLDQEQKDRLVEIASRCPVHRTLTSEITIKARLTPSS